MDNLKKKKVESAQIECMDPNDELYAHDYIAIVEFTDGSSIIMWQDEDGDLVYFTEEDDTDRSHATYIFDDDGHCLLSNETYDAIKQVQDEFVAKANSR